MARGLPNNEAQQQIGRFNLQDLLHSSGTTEIWLATDERGRQFAVRRLKKDLHFNFTARRRFHHSCEVLSQLNESDHIVSYVEHGRDWLAMDYVAAENLQALVARQDPLVAENVAQILIDMATGLSHVHASGYLHLDFKPDNILISSDGRARLIDFDFAQLISEKPLKLAKNSSAPAYLAPELLQRSVADARTDIYAFGVTAYELLTNQRPFAGETVKDVLASQMEPAGPVPLLEHNADTPPQLEKVVMKCLERDPDRRYAFSSVLVRELESALYV